MLLSLKLGQHGDLHLHLCGCGCGAPVTCNGVLGLVDGLCKGTRLGMRRAGAGAFAEEEREEERD